MNGAFNFPSEPLFQDIKLIITTLSHITFEHVYKSKNKEVDQFSKVTLTLEKGTWKIIENIENHYREYLYEPWF